MIHMQEMPHGKNQAASDRNESYDKSAEQLDRSIATNSPLTNMSP